MYCKNIKENGKIVNCYKLLKNYIHLHVSISGLITHHTYLHTIRTSQKINMFI